MTNFITPKEMKELLNFIETLQEIAWPNQRLISVDIPDLVVTDVNGEALGTIKYDGGGDEFAFYPSEVYPSEDD